MGTPCQREREKRSAGWEYDGWGWAVRERRAGAARRAGWVCARRGLLGFGPVGLG